MSNIYIIGAGISGLIAAKVLEENGYNAIILETTNSCGGRMKSEIIDGYTLDKGFQVLLDAYPAVNKHLDLNALNLEKFTPGAAIFKNGKPRLIGDPIRERSLLLPTLFSSAGQFLDKLKVLQLTKALKNKTIQDIFKEEETSTLEYLTQYGFSKKFIHSFFKPFFTGIFLEPELSTSSRMFEFIFKMFGEGFATLPMSGIGCIAEQLQNKLQSTEIRFNTKVKAIRNGEIELENGATIESNYTIVATEANHLIRQLRGQHTEWKSCEVLYFETKNRVINKPLIGLVPDSEALINNIFYHTSLETNPKPHNELLSVTIVKPHQLSNHDLIKQVEKELKQYCGITTHKFIKRYSIPQALPNLRNIQYEISPFETQLMEGIFLAGDTVVNGSLNAAILSGESAAMGVLNGLKDKPVHERI